MQKKLTKSKDKVFLGVCGGIADYLGVDPTMIRLIAVVLIACTGFFPLIIHLPGGSGHHAGLPGTKQA